ncbi:MAG: cytochrome c [Bryobacteraceae bacterium]|jgi:quinoprotein glucose dehydrogenase
MWDRRYRLSILGLAVSVLGAQSVAHSTWDGVYTKSQADRGKDVYVHQCLDCHGDDLEGDPENPPLATPAFVYKWNSLTVGDLFERVHRDMPPDKMGTLTRQKAADLVAFLLSFNKFPPGNRELPPDLTALRQIRFDASPPEATK